ncbi:MAG: OsmC family protein [Candidatus Heimdallarchaeota archaeon]|nr:OsmC family protein [Candidatus Heimdallarchaeota archaeon]
MSSNQLIKEIFFSTTANWEKEKIGKFYTTEYSEPLPFSCPTILGGIETPSPEDLFLSSIATCTVTTLLHMCDKLHTSPNSLQVKVSAYLRLIDGANYEFQAINCQIDVSGEEFLLERACELIPKYCAISNAIQTEINYLVTLNSEKKFTISKKGKKIEQ